MAETIQINEAEYSGKTLMCSGCAQNLLATTPALPSTSSDAPAMQAFMIRLAELGSTISAYKAVLQADVAALESAKQTLVEADKAASGSF